MYRDRLIRAYLGASRLDRKPNPFTRFDPDDNIPIYSLKWRQLDVDSLKNPMDFINKLKNPSDPVSAYLKEKLSDQVKHDVDAFDGKTDPTEKLKKSLISELNHLIKTERLYDELPLKDKLLKPESPKIIEQPFHSTDDPISLNRRLLEEAYPDEIASRQPHKPMPVINIALNLVVDEKLAWQQRKASSFTVTPFHAGNYDLGYRKSEEYGQGRNKRPISLGTALAISGAAVSPNMGYHSSPVVAFLLTLFNVRLGWWLGNPGSKTYKRDSPVWSVRPLLAEAFGWTRVGSIRVPFRRGPLRESGTVRNGAATVSCDRCE